MEKGNSQQENLERTVTYDVSIYFDGVEDGFHNVPLCQIPAIGEGIIFDNPYTLFAIFYTRLDRAYPDIKALYDKKEFADENHGVPTERISEYNEKEEEIDRIAQKYGHLTHTLWRVEDVICYVGERPKNFPAYLIALKLDPCPENYTKTIGYGGISLEEYDEAAEEE